MGLTSLVSLIEAVDESVLLRGEQPERCASSESEWLFRPVAWRLSASW